MKVAARPIALIGPSGAGKSSCLKILQIPESADMDAEFANTASPPLETVLDWLGRKVATERVVAVSVHEQMLRAMQSAKRAGEYPNQFSAWLFVYLRVPKAQLQVQLTRQTAGGVSRPPASRALILRKYDDFDALFTCLADCTVDCSRLKLEAIAEQIGRLAPPANLTEQTIGRGC